MERTLINLGFQTTKITNATQKQMKRSVDKFGQSIRNADVAFFYFAGHGMQVNGRNYLIPVSAMINSENDVEYESVDAGRVLSKMEDAGSAINIVMLDACRDNPFARSFRSSAKGLATVVAPKGSYIAYATAPGQTASDGVGSNGVFTKAFVEAVGKRNTNIFSVFMEVSRIVSSETDNKQIPWNTFNLTNEFYFTQQAQRPAQPSAPKPTPKPQVAKNQKYPLTLKANVRDPYIRFTNVDLAYYDGIKLAPGRYDFEMSKAGYENFIGWLEIENKPFTATIKMTKAGQGKVSMSNKFQDPITGMHFVLVKGGCFNMGSDRGVTDEGPVHRVCVDDFYMGKFEVTNDQFRKFDENAGYWYKTDDYGTKQTLSRSQQPITNVSWNEAKNFIAWLNNQSDVKYRLPTEAEWEYAARGGRSSSFYWGESKDIACDYANVFDKTGTDAFKKDWSGFDCNDTNAVTTLAGSYKPNAYGLYDMIGNVWEYVEDNYDTYAYKSHSKYNPVYKSSAGDSIVTRGGSWLTSSANIHSADRGKKQTRRSI
jgi:formylglycine-generating enzyme required for sulfatase activity